MDKFIPFIIKTARCTYVKGYDMEDLIQMGKVSIIKAVFKYDMDKNTEFTCYAMNSVKKNFYNLIRKNIKFSSCCSLNSLNSEGLEMQDVIPSEHNTEDLILKQETVKSLHEALKKLKAPELEIIDWFYFKNRTLGDYCSGKGIAYRTAVLRKGKAIKKLRKIILNYRRIYHGNL